MIRLNDNEEQQAQRIACTQLVRGCEGAVSDLAWAAEIEGQPPTMKRARAILAQVLSSWRDTLKTLRTVEEPGAVTTAASSLDGWTSEELLAEAVKRRADDGPALRLMQGTVLRAFLTAHDREFATDRLDR